MERHIHGFRDGTVAERLNLPTIRNLPILLAPKDTQSSIASVLGALEDKIELNRRMNETLEGMARAIFKSWFVDFDPVRAKADGRHSPGLDPATAALFPDSFEDSPLGKIPKGWRIRRADEIADVGIGKTPPRKESQWFSTSQADMPWMSIRDLGNCGAYIAKTSEFLTAEAVDRFRIRRIPNNTVVLSFKLTVGRVAITDGEMLSNEAIAHFNLLTDSIDGPEFLYLYLERFTYENLGSTSSIATAVNSKMVKAMPVLVPPLAITSAFSRSILPIFDQMKLLGNQNTTLSLVRDALLPKLLSGQLPTTEPAVFAEPRQ